MKKIIALKSLIILVVIFGVLAFSIASFLKPEKPKLKPASFLQKEFVIPTSTPTPIPTPTPTPKPLTFEEMNKLYGPCIYLPTVFYHHIRDLETAKSKGDLGLSVDPAAFRSQMQYLKNKGYTPATMKDLENFFDQGAAVPGKPILLTFDDGYDDFSTNALPILKEMGFKATVFLPTGLVGNPSFLTWGQVQDAAGSGLVYFANHTWSHHSVAVSFEVDQKEIQTADTQLKERGLNPDLVFAYPYGNFANYAIEILKSMNYKLAFTTLPGRTLCKAQRFTLPRVRIGNAPLSAYGF